LPAGGSRTAPFTSAAASPRANTHRRPCSRHSPPADCPRPTSSTPPPPRPPPRAGTHPSSWRTASSSAGTPVKRSTRRQSHVNAHATSTPVGDIPESLAISELMGDNVGDALVSATKSMTGHLLGGTGAVEAILTAKALQTRTAPPTINIDEVDPKVVGINIVRDTPAELPAGDIAAITNSFGFGGHNAVVAFRSV